MAPVILTYFDICDSEQTAHGRPAGRTASPHRLQTFGQLFRGHTHVVTCEVVSEDSSAAPASAPPARRPLFEIALYVLVRVC